MVYQFWLISAHYLFCESESSELWISRNHGNSKLISVMNEESCEEARRFQLCTFPIWGHAKGNLMQWVVVWLMREKEQHIALGCVKLNYFPSRFTWRWNSSQRNLSFKMMAPRKVGDRHAESDRGKLGGDFDIFCHFLRRADSKLQCRTLTRIDGKIALPVYPILSTLLLEGKWDALEDFALWWCCVFRFQSEVEPNVPPQFNSPSSQQRGHFSTRSEQRKGEGDRPLACFFTIFFSSFKLKRPNWFRSAIKRRTRFRKEDCREGGGKEFRPSQLNSPHQFQGQPGNMKPKPFMMG